MMKNIKLQLYFYKDTKMIKQTYSHQHPNPKKLAAYVDESGREK